MTLLLADLSPCLHCLKKATMILIRTVHRNTRIFSVLANSVKTRAESQITICCTNSYLPWYFWGDLDHLPSCTSSGCILKLCKVSKTPVHSFRRSCAYQKYGGTDGHGDSFTTLPIHPPKKWSARDIIHTVQDFTYIECWENLFLPFFTPLTLSLCLLLNKLRPFFTLSPAPRLLLADSVCKQVHYTYNYTRLISYISHKTFDWTIQ